MAAGLGFKTFATGDVLSAADVNGYLMQGVLVFANAAARDAAITSPQEGQCCYLKDTDATQTYSGSAWVGFDDSNAIQNAIVDAKGDIVTATANDTPARLAVGANDLLLTADSTQSTGLNYTGTWTTWTPTWTGLTVGNGTVVARYCKIGKVCHVFLKLTFGTTTLITAGKPYFTTPITPSQDNMNAPIWITDTGVGEYIGTGQVSSAGVVYLLAQGASGTYVSAAAISSTVPFTWGSTDSLTLNFYYEVA
jgi:hypothetical protein